MVVLLVICVALAVYGWTLRPQSNGYPSVPENMGVTVSAHTGQVVETLTRTAGDGAKLEVLGANVTGPWSVDFADLGAGRDCTHTGFYSVDEGGAVMVVQLAHQTVKSLGETSTGGPPVTHTQVTSDGALDVVFCWAPGAGGPVSLKGSYLSAQFPSIYFADYALNPPDVSLTQYLVPSHGDTANYALQAATAPTRSSAGQWEWSTSKYSIGSDPLRISAVDTNGTQHDSYRSFLSGIAFGVAGGALISLVTELVAPFTRRRDARQPV